MHEDLNVATSVLRSLKVLKGIPRLQELQNFYFVFTYKNMAAFQYLVLNEFLWIRVYFNF